MKLFANLFGLNKNTDFPFFQFEGKTGIDYQKDTCIRIGRQQFEKLKDLGLRIPIALS
jgi:hypothetical protein